MVRASFRRGLTRAEVVVVIGISAVLFALVLPAIQQVRADAGQHACLNNLRQIGIGTSNYHDTYNSFAPGMDNQYVGELVRLLPFVNRGYLYKNFSFDPQYSLYFQNPYNRPPSDGTDNIPRPPDLYGCEGEVDIFLCPDGPQPNDSVTALLVARYGTAGTDFRADDGLSGQVHVYSSSPGRLIMARSHYLGMAGDFRDPNLRGIFTFNSRTRMSDLIRGASNTIANAEIWGGYVVWGGQGGIPDGFSIGSRSAGFNYSAFGTCPNPANGGCDNSSQGMGLSIGAFGALHATRNPGHPNKFNVVMADGSARHLLADIDFAQWEIMCSIRGGQRPIHLEEEEVSVSGE
jgi:prepilin-type processing-associated H-X9-DG protein